MVKWVSVTYGKLELLTISSDIFTNLEFRISKLLFQIFIKIYFSTGKLRQKSYFENKKFKFVFFFNCSNWEKFVEKLANQIGEGHLTNS